MTDSNGEVIGVFQAINKLPNTSSFSAEDIQQITSFSSVGKLSVVNLESCINDAKITRIQDNADRITRYFTI